MQPLFIQKNDPFLDHSFRWGISQVSVWQASQSIVNTEKYASGWQDSNTNPIKKMQERSGFQHIGNPRYQFGISFSYLYHIINTLINSIFKIQLTHPRNIHMVEHLSCLYPVRYKSSLYFAFNVKFNSQRFFNSSLVNSFCCPNIFLYYILKDHANSSLSLKP